MGRSFFVFKDLLLVAFLFLQSHAFAAAGNLPDQQRANLALADSLFRASAVDSAQTILGLAIPLAHAESDSGYLLQLISRQGAQLAAFGNVKSAEPILREALTLAESLADSAITCQVLRWLSFSVVNQGRVDEAEEVTRRQIDLAEALGLHAMVGWARVGLGWYAEQRGQAAISADEYRAAAEVFQAIADSSGEAWSLNNLGNALNALGKNAEARTIYLRSAEIARRIDYTMVEAMAISNLGVMEFTGGDPSVAVTLFRRANDLHSRLGHSIEVIRTDLNIGLCLINLDKLAEAASHLEGVVAEAEGLEQPELHVETMLTLASLRRRQGRIRSAKALLRRVADEPKDIPPVIRSEGLRALAAILADQDSVQAGLEVLDTSIPLLAGLPNSPQAVQVDNLRGELLIRSNRWRDGLTTLLQVERRAHEAGLSGQRVQALTQAARAYRALGLPDSSVTLLARAAGVWEQERSLPRDPQWREQRGAQGNRLYTDWATHLLEKTGGLPEAFAQLQLFKGRTLLERMNGPGDIQAAADEIGKPGSITLARLQQEVLAEGELLLDAYLGPETSLLFAVTRDEARVLNWPPAAELERRIGFFYDLHQIPATGEASAAELEALHHLGAEIGNLLLGEIGDLIESCHRLILVPDGVLNLMPWSGLTVKIPGADGRSVELAQKQVVCVPSVTIHASLGFRDGRGQSSGQARILAFAPDGVADVAGSGVNDLPGARQEVAWLMRSFTQVVDGNDPSFPAGNPTTQWRDFDVLHFATHVRSYDASPWQSEIRLAGAEPTTVRAVTIAGSELAASLVVLAGCESAGGNILSGEGVQGLTSAFLSAGAQVVLATLWPVEDQATFEMIQLFYSELAAGHTATEALNVAQSLLRHVPRTQHPFYWAGFVLVGDGEVIIELEPKSSVPISHLLSGVLLVVSLGFLVIFFARRRLS